MKNNIHIKNLLTLISSLLLLWNLGTDMRFLRLFHKFSSKKVFKVFPQITHSCRDIEIVDEKLCISEILLFLYQSRGCLLFFGVILSGLFGRAMFVWTNIRHGREHISLWATLSIKTESPPPNLSPLQM